MTVFDVGSEDGRPYVVCELLEGETLRERIGFQPTDTGQTLDIALQLARGLACAHQAGIVHRDLKPEKRGPHLVEITVIHEMLHTLGLGENPPSSRAITNVVRAHCDHVTRAGGE